MPKYTILTTFPGQRSSANVGDKLIEISLKRLIEHEHGPVEFLTYFREDSLEDHLDAVNATAGIVFPLGIRAVPSHPFTYRLVDDLDRIRVPLIPICSTWNAYPGDSQSRAAALDNAPETLRFLSRIASGVTSIACREFHTCEILRRHGFHNTIMAGDPTWFDPEYFGQPIYRPDAIKQLVFSPPLSAYYGEQGVLVLEMLATLFPQARRYCVMHLTDAAVSPFADKRPTHDASMRPDVAEKNALIRRRAAQLGFEVVETSGDLTRIDFYRGCDLHVGYECHAHLAFLRWRRPSVLIAEDARGVGFNYTLGVGGFTGFIRVGREPSQTPKEGGTSGYCVTTEEFAAAPARTDVGDEIRQYLKEECSTRFRRYHGLAAFIDETYREVMGPFIRSLPRS